MQHYVPESLIIEREVEGSVLVRNVLRAWPALPVHWIDSLDSLLNQAKHHGPSITQAKRHLVLARNRGSFLKACPGGHGRNGCQDICCGYFVIDLVVNCPMECSYCYLQAYLNLPHLVIYANTNDLFAELQNVFEGTSGRFFRVGTGELSDSLALDPLTAHSAELVRFFARQRNAVLELKTKTNLIENLLGLDHRNRTLVGWSLNPGRIQSLEEHKTASLAACRTGIQHPGAVDVSAGVRFTI